ncbi:MAG: hypothetical protein WDZ83_04735 [Rhizobiaceae bacterium]
MPFGKCTAVALMLAATSVVANATATSDHDPAIEAAAIRLAVSKLGELRDGFQPGETPRFYQPRAARANARDGDQTAWQDGLAPATDLPRMTIGQP